MKKLLFLFDTDPYASVFDTVVAYDGGADRVTGYANVTPDNVGTLVDGTIFTRGGKEKQNTAIFVGGGDMGKGEALLKADPWLTVIERGLVEAAGIEPASEEANATVTTCVARGDFSSPYPPRTKV